MRRGPNDPSNNSRALLLLAKHGLITLKDPNDELATTKDITSRRPHAPAPSTAIRLTRPPSALQSRRLWAGRPAQLQGAWRQLQELRGPEQMR